ncbi:beta strand repeat-containing protein [Spongiimicrobium sp. 3-5]|uniref:beta strand repeat-containing protein n=1 Tax=Spongiimicrobium sp. 3-5 TaxID=3332596 RepID=UPI003980636D
MKKLIFSIAFLFTACLLHAQVGIGTIMPDGSTQLDVVSTDRGILIPRVELQSATDATTINNGNKLSLLVFNTNTMATDLAAGYCYWDGAKWQRLTNADDLAALETLTSLVDNGDGTLTYTDEAGTANVVPVSALAGNVAVTDGTVDIDNDGTPDNGVNLQDVIDNLNNIVQGNESLTTLGMNADGINLDYRDEEGNTSQIDLSTVIAASADITTDAWVDGAGLVELGTLSDGVTARPVGTEFVALDNGNVGIGTTTPIEPLTISDNDAAVNNTLIRLSNNLTSINTGVSIKAQTNAVDTDGGLLSFINSGHQGYAELSYTSQGTAGDELFFKLQATGVRFGGLLLPKYVGANFDETNPNYVLSTNGATGDITKTSIADLAAASQTNTTLALDNPTGVLTYTNEDNDNPTVNLAAIEPWFGTDNNAGATENTEDIYTLGNVGIGTETPAVPLDIGVQGDDFPVVRLTRTGGITRTDGSWQFNIGSDGRFVLDDVTNGRSVFGFDQGVATNTLYVNSNSNVAIGILSGNATEKLDVNGKVRVRNLTETDLPTDVIVTADATTGVLKEGGTVADLVNNAETNTTLALDNPTGVLTYTNEDNDNPTVDLTAIEPWFGTDNNAGATLNTEDIYTTGFVGIGDPTPDSQLSVSDGGTQGVTIGHLPRVEALAFNRDVLTGQIFDTSRPSFQISNNANLGPNKLVYEVYNNTTNVRTLGLVIDQDSNIGINQVNPSARLDVSGGDVQFESYPNTRDDSGATAVNNVLYTDATGNILSAPLTAVSAPQTNTTLALDNPTGVLTYTNEDNDNPTVNLAAIEPWFGTDDNAGATDNTEDIYTLGNVGIGRTATPTIDLAIEDLSGGSAVVDVVSNLVSGFTSEAYRNSPNTHILFRGFAARGTKAAPLALNAGDDMLYLDVEGHNGTTFSGLSTGRIGFEAAENFTPTANGLDIFFITTGLGTTAATEKMRIAADGQLTFNTYTGTNWDEANPNYVLSTNGTTGEVTKTSIADLAAASQTNTTLALDNPTGVLTYTNEDNDNPTVNLAAIEPWFGTDDNAGATDNTEDIYTLGNVGIGTSTIFNQTRFQSDAPNTGFAALFRTDNVGRGFALTDQFTSEALQFNQLPGYSSIQALNDLVSATTGNSLVLQSAGGNVGIGTTTPNEKLEVNGKVRVSDLTGADLATDVIVTADATTGELKEAGTIATLIAASADATTDAWVDAAGRVELGTQSDGTTARPNGTQFVALDNGDVGIGITAPTAKTHISGIATPTTTKLRVDGYFTGSNVEKTVVFAQDLDNGGEEDQLLRLENSTSAGGTPTGYLMKAFGDNQSVGTASDLDEIFAIRTSGEVRVNTDQLVVQPAGNVGIGTTTPNEKLDVNGKVRVRNLTETDLPTDVIVTADATTGVLKEAGTIASVAAAAADGDAWGVTGEDLTSAITRTGDVTLNGGDLTLSKGNNVFLNMIRPGAGNDFRFNSEGGFFYLEVGTDDTNFPTRILRTFGSGQLQFSQYTGTNFDETNPNYVLSTNGTTGDITKTSIADIAAASADGDAWAVTGEDQTSNIGRTGNVGIGGAATTAAKLDVSNSGTEDILNLRDNGTEVMTVLDGGDVGIGTIAPTAKTHIVDNVPSSTALLVEGYTGNSNASVLVDLKQNIQAGGENDMVLRLEDTNPAGIVPTGYLMKAFGDNQNVGTATDLDEIFAIRTSGEVRVNTDHLVVQPAGNVGIGTAAPTAKTHISGSTTPLTTKLRVDGYFSGSTIEKTVVFAQDLDNGGEEDQLLRLENSTSAGGTPTGYLMKAFGDNHSVGTATDLDEIFAIRTSGEVRVNTDHLVVQPAGNVGIGTTAPTERLDVSGNIRATGNLQSGTTTYPDYVFEEYLKGENTLNKTYTFKTLPEVEAFIKVNKHLPGVTGIEQLEKTENGYTVNMTALSMQTLEKVEELYLHTIAQEKKLEALQQENNTLKARLAKIEAALGLDK